MHRQTIFVSITLLMLFILSLAVAAARSGVLNLAGGDTAEVVCDGKRLRLKRESATKVTLNCRPGNQPATATPEPSPTEVPPTEVPPTPEPEPTDNPSSEIPLCPNHDPTEWHPLYDAEQNCHYDHEHKENPGDVDDLFGPTGDLYGGQEISYPWQTFSDAGTENEVKHGGYGWLVRRDVECSSAFTDGCLTDFRVQYHAIMAAHGAVTRFHSFWMEARGCREDNPDVCGIIRTGGWVDTGKLEIDGEHIPLPGDPSQDVSGRRIHYYETGNSNFGTWYGNNSMVTVAVQTNRMWGLINPDNPSELHLFCPDYQCANNNSMMQAHAIGFYIPPSLDTDGDGIVNFEGYTNRQGQIVENCTEVGLDCIPAQVINMPVGRYQYRDDTQGIGDGITDHDTSHSGEWWIRYPN